MKRRALVLLTAFALVVVAIPSVSVVAPAGAALCPSHGGKYEPPPGQRLLVIGQDRDQAVNYVNATGQVPGGFMTYTHVASPILGLHLPVVFGGTSHGQHFIDNYPNSVLTIGLGLGNPALVNLGLYDTSIQTLGDWIWATHRPIFVRIGYEFDTVDNNYPPADYVLAYRRIVDRIRAMGVRNAAFVWHSGSKGTTGPPMEAWYPGDGYVDFAAVSLFNSGQLYWANLMADIADAKGIPLMIAESTPLGQNTAVDGNTLWAGWYSEVLNFITTRNVRIWSYINQNWEQAGWGGWGDSRVEANPVLKDLWLAETNQSTWLKGTPGMFCDGLGHNP